MRSALRRLPAASSVVAALATGVALYSAWHSGGHVWRQLNSEYRTYAAYTPTERRHAPIDKLPLPSDVFDFYRVYVGRGDRVYFQVQESGFGQFLDLPEAVAAAGRFYLLPAVQVPDVRHATVVVSFKADPGLFQLHFVTQARAGLNPYFVSRLRGR